MRGALLIALAALLAGATGKMPVAHYREFPSLREMDAMEKRWVQKRYEYIPQILEKHGYDTWILTMREYNEDPVLRSLVSSTTVFSARRRTVYIFHTNPDVPNPSVFVDLEDGVWPDVVSTLNKLDPQRIAVNRDELIAFGDGLHRGEWDLFLSHIPDTFHSRISSNPALAVETIAYRAGGSEQLDMYRLLQENVWAMIQQGFSEEVVQVGKTTATDLEWWFRDVMRWRFGVGTWFSPDVTIFRHPDEPSVEASPEMREGDMLHVDIGIWAMNMATDTQHLAYILRANETSPPQSLVDGLHNANKMQDFVRKHMIPGRAGNDVLANATKAVKDAGLRGLIYSHPIGDYGHSAGSYIGTTGNQGPNKWGGQMPVTKNFWTSVELGGVSWVPEWQRDQRFNLEEDVYWDAETGGFEWVFGQQTEYHLVQPKKGKHEHQHKDKHGKHGKHGKHEKHGKHGAKGHQHGLDEGEREAQTSGTLVQLMADWAGWAVGRWM